MALSDQLVKPLLIWYEQNARDLPWRREITPYRVWVSEIMLQQTRASAVKPYFARFMAELPNVQSLAEVSEQKLLKLWEGLGYYSRARNLQKAAVQICQRHGGELPADVDALRALCGIGDYTAGAIASIAFGLPEPAVDGNVLRVWARLTGDGRDVLQPAVQKAAREDIRSIIPVQTAGNFTQALIELGATVCMPAGQAKCHACPLQAFCTALAEQRVENLPCRSKAKPRKIIEKSVLVLHDGKRVLVCQRPGSGLLAGMYEFYSPDVKPQPNILRAHVEKMGVEVLEMGDPVFAKHIFTHLEWHMTAFAVRVADLSAVSHLGALATVDELDGTYAIPSAHRAFYKLALQLLK